MSDNMYKSYKKDDKVLPKTSWSSYQDDDLDSENEMDNNEDNLENEEDDNDHQDENGKGKNKKKYSVISQAVREKFIKRVLSKEVTIKEAAKEFGLKFSTSKAILQTYKKEGRIGKKKNRERKTKVVNAVFIANISANNPFVSSLPAPLNDIKNINLSASTDASTNQQYDSSGFNKYADPKAAKGAIGAGFNNKATQNIIKEFGNDFLRDFIEKNFGQARIGGLGQGPFDRNLGTSNDLNTLQNNANLSSTINLPSVSNQRPLFNFGTSNTTTKVNQIGFNSIAGLSNTSLLPQKVSSINSDGTGQQGFNLNQNRLFNPVRQSTLEEQNKSGQKRSFQNYEKDNVPELGRNESINDISVKKFKSGEDNLWDFDMDRSKKDLEDFIYKTHNAMKNSGMNENKPIANFADFS